MNRGILAKSVREAWPITLFCGLALAVAEMAMAYALLGFQEEIAAAWSAFAIFQDVIRTILGADVRDQIGPQTIAAVAWVHPLILALFWAHPMVFCTRIPVGEVDRGTIDVLLGLPVSRWQLYRAETGVWLATSAMLIAAAAGGNVLGRLVAGGTPVQGGLAPVLANLAALSLAVGGLAWFLSAMCDRRGRALAIQFGLAIGSLLLQYLAQFWALAERFSAFGLLHYYRPLASLQTGAWPVRDIAVLAGLGAALWAMAGVVFARRDLATV